MSNQQFYEEPGYAQHHQQQQSSRYYNQQDQYSQPQNPSLSNPPINTTTQPQSNQYYSPPAANQSPYQHPTNYDQNHQNVATLQQPQYDQSNLSHQPSPHQEQELLRTKKVNQAQYKKVNYKRFVKEKKYIRMLFLTYHF